ncbi:hypothetical protein [Rhodococcus sp. T2V]|uniref:hypothetical protein n=1 Tax=Rhodococcus sp. T2V TaxID=3034164 RepID=UPI0023E1ED32|nr:hypothetical protein [Rhodococcus sp. T2V]
MTMPGQLLTFCRDLRGLYPVGVRLAIVCENFSPHLTTMRCRRVPTRAELGIMHSRVRFQLARIVKGEIA